MPLQSDIQLPVTKFNPANISEKTRKLNAHFKAIGDQGPAWYEVGAATARQLRLEGKTPFPIPPILPQGKDLLIPSRTPGRSIPARLFYPSTATGEKPKTRGVVMHIHGGGWVLLSHLGVDTLLQAYANGSGCAVISVGYRLAPEHPFPQGPEDCEDVAGWLVDHAEEEYGGGLMFMGGESAGAHLSVQTTLHLLRTRPTFTLPGGLLLHFGCYDLSVSPSAFILSDTPILPLRSIQEFIAAFAPDQDPKSPVVSPLYADLEEFRGRLPAALFTCGTVDPLLDDNILMSARWMMAGAQTGCKFYTGACHGFLSMGTDEAVEAMRDTMGWIGERFGEGK